MSQWPVIFLSQEDRDSIKTALSAINETRKRVTAYLGTRKRQRFYIQYKAAIAQMNEMLEDLAEETVALSHKEIIFKIVYWADTNNMPRKQIVNVTSAAINKAMALWTKGSLSRISTGWYLDNQNAAYNIKLVERIKDMLARPNRLINAGSDTYVVGNIICALCDTCTCYQLISMMTPCEDGEIFDGITESGPLEKLLSTESIEQNRKYLQVLNDEYSNAKKSCDDLKKKFDVSELWLTEPLDNVINNHESNKLDCLVASLCVMARMNMLIAMSADKASYDKDDLIESNALYIGGSTHFWRIILVQLLVEVAGIIDNKLALWVHSLIDFLVKHPLKIKGFKLPIEADKAKSVFAKLGAHYLRGYHPDEQCLGNVDKWVQYETEQNEYLQVVSVYFAGVMTNKSGITFDNISDCERMISDLYKKIIYPNMKAIIRWMYECATNTTEDADLNPEPQAPVPEIDELKPETWYYVRNPAAGMTVSDPVTFCDSEGLKGYFREHRIDATIKPESIMNALVHYKLMPQSIRAVMPQEYCGREGWHKIKRGGLRILAKLDEKEQLYFNIYPRKEWEYRATV